ncbi:hypothetical protein AB672_07765 [Xylella taiwanensis]|nr:hypothetical protein AB672_07765 [Xylella taiwanensis]
MQFLKGVQHESWAPLYFWMQSKMFIKFHRLDGKVYICCYMADLVNISFRVHSELGFQSLCVVQAKLKCE